MTLSLLAILTSSFIILIFASCSLFLPLIFSKSYSSCFSCNISWGSDDPVDIYSLIYRMFSSVMYINVNKFFICFLNYFALFWTILNFLYKCEFPNWIIFRKWGGSFHQSPLNLRNDNRRWIYENEFWHFGRFKWPT